MTDDECFHEKWTTWSKEVSAEDLALIDILIVVWREKQSTPILTFSDAENVVYQIAVLHFKYCVNKLHAAFKNIL